MTVMAGVSLVFSIQWLKKAKEAMNEHNQVGELLSLITLLGSLGLAVLLHNCFESYFKEIKTSWSIIIFLWFLTLGITQLIWENYSMIKDWVIVMGKKKIENKVDSI
jgi:hypothetical protein